MRLNVRAPICNTGYGIAAKNIITALINEGVSVALWPIGPIQCSETEKHFIQTAINRQATYDKNADSLVIFHQFALAEHVGKGRRVGFPIFELDNFTERELHHLASQDLLFVCSNWAKDIIIKCNISVPTYVVPLGVDRTIFHEGLNKQEKYSGKCAGGPTIFINVGKWEIRKGHDFLINCFNKAFEPADNVLLRMAPHNPFLNTEELNKWIELVRRSRLADKIQICGPFSTQQQLAAFMAEGDIGVYCSRAEGFNLELLESMSLGLNIIATFNTAHTEFLNGLNGHCVVSHEKEPAYDGKWFNGRVGNWTKLCAAQEEQCIEYMRALHKKRQDGELNLNEYGIETAKRYSWQNTTQTIIDSLITDKERRERN